MGEACTASRSPSDGSSGHRRYPEGTVDQVAQVPSAAATPRTRLEAAIAEARSRPALAAKSVFAGYAAVGTRSSSAHRLKKSTLLALSWALEDECCARAQRPVLFGVLPA